MKKKEFIIKNEFNNSWARTFRGTMFFEEGDVYDLNTLVALDASTNVAVRPVWHQFGPRNPDGSIWYARADIQKVLPPGETKLEIMHEKDLPELAAIVDQKFEFDQTFLAGLAQCQLLVAFKPSGSTGPLDYKNILDPKYSVDPDLLYEGLSRVYRTEAVSNGIRFRAWFDYGSSEFGSRFKLQIANDDGINPPGLVEGEFYMMMIGGHLGFKFWKQYGIDVVHAGDIGEVTTSTWKFPISDLAGTQSWMCAGAIGFSSLEDMQKDVLAEPLMFMSRETALNTELPEYALPVVNNSAWRTQLQSSTDQKLAEVYSTRQDPWHHLGGSKNPAQSGEQPQFGHFPGQVRNMLENSDRKAFDLLLSREMRVMSARPGWIKGLFYQDVGDPTKNPEDSTNTWTDQVHFTSKNKWGQDRPGYVRGSTHGWQGQDHQHYGMTPAFWVAIVSGDRAMIDVYRDRAVMGQCFYHTLSLGDGGYFGSWVDAIRGEGRLCRVLWQAYMLTADPSFLNSLEVRAEKIIREYRDENQYEVKGDTNEYQYYTEPGFVSAPYGNKGDRQRPDARCPGYPEWNNPQIYVVWQSGMLITAFWKLWTKTGNQNAFDICVDMTRKFIEEGFVLEGEQEPGGKTGMKKYFAADNPASYKVVDWRMQGLTKWPTNIIFGMEKEIYDLLSPATQERYWVIYDRMLQEYPDIKKDKWGVTTYREAPVKPIHS